MNAIFFVFIIQVMKLNNLWWVVECSCFDCTSPFCLYFQWIFLVIFAFYWHNLRDITAHHWIITTLEFKLSARIFSSTRIFDRWDLTNVVWITNNRFCLDEFNSFHFLLHFLNLILFFIIIFGQLFQFFVILIKLRLHLLDLFLGCK